ncbi:hypothetical protein Nepgr_033481 [Nepenthes gracilis]|uniref:Histone-lysine N-methyltransferase ASHH1 n=1 Tax=Nepenthes gracilis TaxID=150966 RepID=A0AAD3TMP7_NEPGR|nr:hypothetical protein Nepgr_033481 [Nepenthes gracilis]
MDYIHINQNDFLHRKHKKHREEDVAICVCKYDANDPDSACGETCLNVLTSTECTPGYCPCGVCCNNQRFQRCEYAKTKLFDTGCRGWGLLADENIKAGRFIIEYCGEVISLKDAERRAQAYETLGIKDAYIISLNAYESIDATRKGSLARFINHSCQPNCETRKWTVLGEIRVGIFAKHDISMGTELTYDYNFEWYGGAKVRCLCGAACCSGFLGAKSRGFQEDTYLWEDDDDRYSVEKVPLYDSAEDEPLSKFLESTDCFNQEFVSNGKDDYSSVMDVDVESNHLLHSNALSIVPLDSFSMNGVDDSHEKTILSSEDSQVAYGQRNVMISPIQSNIVCQNSHIGTVPVLKKKLKRFPMRSTKRFSQKAVDAKFVAQLLADKEAQDEILSCEQMKNEAASNLEHLYNEIRPAIEEHERDSQDSVATSVAEKWIEASCLKLKTEFDLHFSIIKNIVSNPVRKKRDIGQEDEKRKEEEHQKAAAVPIEGGSF